MKHVSILVPETAVPAAIVDPQYMFSAVNMFFSEAGHRLFFKVQLVGMRKKVNLSGGSVTINTDLVLRDVKRTDLIIVPAISGDVRKAIDLNKELYPWIREHHAKGAEVASLCIGAFLLASTGLLEGKTCSTHWLFAGEFRSMFPGITLAEDKVVTEQNGLYSSGGASLYWNLLLYLVEKYTGREMSVIASKFFLLDIARNSQSPFAMFRGQKEHDDKEVLKAQEYIEQHFAERFSVEDLAERCGIGRRTFERRFRKATTNTVIEYMQRVRIESAKRQFERGIKTVNEVMYDAGYTDTKAFRDVFRRIAGLTPLDYRNRYNPALR